MSFTISWVCFSDNNEHHIPVENADLRVRLLLRTGAVGAGGNASGMQLQHLPVHRLQYLHISFFLWVQTNPSELSAKTMFYI
jgi:hypothetical protein